MKMGFVIFHIFIAHAAAAAYEKDSVKNLLWKKEKKVNGGLKSCNLDWLNRTQKIRIRKCFGSLWFFNLS